MKKTEQNQTGLTPAELKGLLDAVSDDQPLPASGNELILLEVDPHRAHAYWNVDPNHAKPGQPLVLRVYDITESGGSADAGQVFDVEVYGLQGRWYLDFWRDERTFVCDIGYRNRDGSLDVMARSNEVQTPPAAPVDPDVTGSHVDHNGDPLHTEYPDYLVPKETPPSQEAGEGADAVDASDAEAPAAVEIEAEPVEAKPEPMKVEPVRILEPEFPVADWDKPAGEDVNPDAGDGPEPDVYGNVDTALAAGDASVAFEDEIMSGYDADDDRSDRPPDEAPIHTLADDFPSAEELAASITEDHAALQAFYEAAGPEAEYREELPPEPSRNEGAEHTPGHEPPPAGLPPLEQIVGLSSMENAGKDVLLEVNAELHIYGRSKPNTELTLYGQIVKTRPDGTFSVRRMLPHGAVVLPLLYTNKDT